MKHVVRQIQLYKFLNYYNDTKLAKIINSEQEQSESVA